MSDLADFPARIRAASWFSSVGQPLTQPEREDARAYLAGLGLGEPEVVQVASWSEAQAVISAPGWSEAWWRAEEERRAQLLARAEGRGGRSAVLAALSDIAQKASDVVHGAAAVSAARDGIADPGLLRAAAGAATQSCYQAAVEAAAHMDDERAPFAAKFRLFEAGHWPLSLNGDRYCVF